MLPVVTAYVHVASPQQRSPSIKATYSPSQFGFRDHEEWRAFWDSQMLTCLNSRDYFIRHAQFIDQHKKLYGW
jgi:hypothetical protein